MQNSQSTETDNLETDKLDTNNIDTDTIDTVIIGGGLAGLTCAASLTEAGRDVTVLEASDRVGGRVRSDNIDGFTMDHGFQVLLTAYPACQKWLDYDALRLRPFEPGALIRQRGKFRTLGDPWRRPGQAIATALNPVGSLADKLRIAKVRHAASRGSLDDLYQRAEMPTIQYLRKAGFSKNMIDQFFRPFIGGVFLNDTLSTSSRMFEFVFRMFAGGDVVVPADGMAAIPRQLAERLPRGSIRFHQTVIGIDPRDAGAGFLIRMSDRSTVEAHRVVVATESGAAARLLGIETLDTAWNGTTNLYYAADTAPDKRKTLMLAGDETDLVQTAVVISNAAPEYAPPGKALISISLVTDPKSVDVNDPAALDAAVRAQMTTWFGETVGAWRHLMTYQVPYGLPARTLDPVIKSPQAADHGGLGGVVLCGDYCDTPSIQGAMSSGERAAQVILAN